MCLKGFIVSKVNCILEQARRPNREVVVVVRESTYNFKGELLMLP